MRKRIEVSLAVLSLVAACVISSCHVPAEGGGSASEIRFSGRTTGGLLTKTSYSGVIDGSVERIDWVDGDQLTIVSPSAQVYDKSQNPWKLKHNQGTWSKVEYEVKGSTISGSGTSTVSSARIEATGGNGLLWEQTGPYYFYGIYPSEGGGVSISWSGSGAGQGNLSAAIPSPQDAAAVGDLLTSTFDSGKKVRKLSPNMSNAFMYAALQATVAKKGEGPDVTLDFYPMFTAFEFTVGAVPDGNGDPVDLEISRFELVSETCDLSGVFTSTVTLGSGSSYNAPSGSRAEYTVTGGQKSVLFTMPLDASNKPVVKVSSTDSVVFTVFVLPKGIEYSSGFPSWGDAPGQSTITDLEIRFEFRKVGETQWTGRKLALKPKDPENYPKNGITLNARDYVEFPAGRKIRLSNIQLPVQQDPWRFSVDVTNLEQEPSDVAVTPVAVQKWDMVDMPDLDTYTVTLPDKLEVAVGGTKTLTATVKNGSGTVIQATVMWNTASLDKTKATITAGSGATVTLKGESAGEAGTITASVKIGDVTVTSNACAVTVVANSANTSPYLDGGKLF